jgi:hypothetical protein
MGAREGGEGRRRWKLRQQAIVNVYTEETNQIVQ